MPDASGLQHSSGLRLQRQAATSGTHLGISIHSISNPKVNIFNSTHRRVLWTIFERPRNPDGLCDSFDIQEDALLGLVPGEIRMAAAYDWTYTLTMIDRPWYSAIAG